MTNRNEFMDKLKKLADNIATTVLVKDLGIELDGQTYNTEFVFYRNGNELLSFGHSFTVKELNRVDMVRYDAIFEHVKQHIVEYVTDV